MNILNEIKKTELTKAQQCINDYIDNIEKENKELKEIIRTYNKDSEIQKLVNKVNIIRHNSLHISTNKEKEDIKNFSAYHYKKCKSNSEIIIIGTGIGNVIKVRCTKCKEEKDVTDINNW